MLHENSTKSYEEHKASGKRESYRFRAFQIIQELGLLGITDRQVMQTLGENDPNNVRPEITRLKEDGIVCETGKTKCKTTGKTVRLVCCTGTPYFEKGNKTRAKK